MTAAVFGGAAALQAAFTSPEAFEPSPKRRLADREIFLAGSMIAVTEMVAAVFAEVLARASPRLNEPACGVDVNDSAAFPAAESEAWTVLERSYQLLFA
jgi:hypothetical protein